MRIGGSRRTASRGALALAAAALAASCTGLTAPAGAAQTWPTYHGDNARTGVAAAEPSLRPISQAWKAQLDGAVFGQPVVLAGRVIVGTENNTLYGLDGHDGHVLWSYHVGPPVPLSVVRQVVNCGNIDPLGITGTPAVDPTSGRVFAVAEILGIGTDVHHQLIGVNAFTGFPEVSTPVDPPGAAAITLQQRTALALGNGRVYFGMGGLYGDCPPYHGWVVSTDENGRDYRAFNVTPTTSRGAVWATSGPAIDAAGSVYVSTGNGDPSTLEYQDSVVKLDPLLSPTGRYTPPEWKTLDALDQDLGSVGPSLLPNGRLFAVGKFHDGFLLDPNNLAVGAVRVPGVCSGDADGGNAAAGGFVYVPCNEGVRAVDIGSASLSWQQTGGPNGPPVISGGLLWSLSWGSPEGPNSQPGSMFGLDPATGAILAGPVPVGNVPHFAAPSAALGLLLVGTVSGVTALSGPAGPPPPAATFGVPCNPPPDHRGYWLAATDGGVFAFGGAPFCGSLGSLRLNGSVVGLAPTASGAGYWMAGADGGVFAFGDARFSGSMGNTRLNAPVMGIAATPSGRGYWLVGYDGGVFAFGDAGFYGSMGNTRLNAPVVGMAATPTGRGYWLAAADGGVFAFGDARFYGSMGGSRLKAQVSGIAAAPNGGGYWLVAFDGGVFNFGTAGFHGSTGGLRLNAPVLSLSPTVDGTGYWLGATDGGVFAFDAPYQGSMGGTRLNRPVVTVARD